MLTIQQHFRLSNVHCKLLLENRNNVLVTTLPNDYQNKNKINEAVIVDITTEQQHEQYESY